MHNNLNSRLTILGNPHVAKQQEAGDALSDHLSKMCYDQDM